MPPNGLLPGEHPSRIGNREFDFAQQMEDEVKALNGPAADYDVIMVDNRASSARDADEGSLLVRRPPHVVRPAKDTGVFFQRNEIASSLFGFEYLRAKDVPDANEAPIEGFKKSTKWWKKRPGSKSKTNGEQKPETKLVNSAIHHHTVASLIAFAQIEKCYLCRELTKSLQRRCPRAFEVQNLSNYRTEICWKQCSKADQEITLYFVLAHPTAKRDVWNPTHYYRAKLWPKQTFGKHFDDPKSNLPALESIGSGSERSVALALQWLARCRANVDGKHTQCKDQTKNFRHPNRVLDVFTTLSTNRLKLVSPVSEVDLFSRDRDFITLSHCWGTWGAEHSPKLTSQNIRSRFSIGLDLDNTPKTFRQALEIANWFGVRWLWIDCLCIIQDSLEDWLLEASLMADNYKNALLNISADAFDDARKGCFVDRDPLDITPIETHASNLDQSWYVIPTDHHLFDWMDNAPSFSRAWIHRERQLSRRILHFTGKEIVWECCGTDKAGFASEMFANGAPFTRTFNRENKFQICDVLNEDIDPTDIHATWNDVCENLSRKRLTKATDMPIVLSSIAEEFDAIPPAGEVEYVGGLWKSEFPECLLWDSSTHFRKSEEYIAPSWSWLSVAAPVKLNHRVVPLQWWQDAVVRVEDIELELKYPNQPFGRLASGVLTMEGHLRRIRLSFKEGGKGSFDLSVYDDQTLRHIGSSWDDYIGDLCRISMDDMIDSMEFDYFCLFVTIQQWKDVDTSRSIACLLLEATEEGHNNGDTYRRIGTLDLEDL